MFPGYSIEQLSRMQNWAFFQDTRTHEAFRMQNRECFQFPKLGLFPECRIEHVSRMQHSGGFQNAKSSMFSGCRMEPASRMQVFRIPGCITDKVSKCKTCGYRECRFSRICFSIFKYFPYVDNTPLTFLNMLKRLCFCGNIKCLNEINVLKVRFSRMQNL